MNEKSSILLLLVVVMFCLVGFVIYDAKTNNRLGFGKDKTDDNWQWEDQWDGAPVEPKIDPKVAPKVPTPVKPLPEQLVVGTYAEAIKKAAELKMPVLVLFESDQCSWCKKMKEETFPDPKVQEAIKKYIVVHVDVYKDKAIAKKFGVKYLPSYVVTNAQEESVKVDGGFKTADQFVQWLDAKEPSPQVEPKKPQEKQPNRRLPRRPQMCSEITEE